MGWSRMDRAGEGIALWHPGKGESTGQLCQEDLISGFLTRTAAMPPESVAKIAGISISSLQRWRESDSPKVSNRMRRRLEEYMGSDPAEEP